MDFESGMTWGQWAESEYNTENFVITNKTQEFVINATDERSPEYIENDQYGISTGEAWWACNNISTLISYELLYNETLGRIVTTTDEVSDEYTYSVWGSMC